MEQKAQYDLALILRKIRKSYVAWIPIAVIALIVSVSWSGKLDSGSAAYVDNTLERSLLAFATARGLNGVISVVQSTTFSFSMLGGIGVGGGEILDPVNDLVEQYSTMMKLSIGSLFVQKVLIKIVSHSFFKIAATISGILLIASLMAKSATLTALATRTFIFIVFLRFIIVLILWLNSLVSQFFIQDQISADVSYISSVSSDISEAITTSEEEQRNRESASNAIPDLRDRIETETYNRQLLDERLELATQRLEAADQALSSARSEVGLIDRFRSGNPEIDSAIEQRDLADEELRGLQEEYDNLTVELDRMQSELVRNENIAAGRPNTLVERAQGNWAGIVNTISPEAVRDRFEASVENIIRVMSLFLFETLLLPLFFLYLLSKGMGRIWDVDLKKMLGFQGDTGSKVTKQPQSVASSKA